MSDSRFLINTEALKAWTGYTRPSDIERWLEDHGVKYWRGKSGNPITTLAEIERHSNDAATDPVF